MQADCEARRLHWEEVTNTDTAALHLFPEASENPNTAMQNRRDFLVCAAGVSGVATAMGSPVLAVAANAAPAGATAAKSEGGLTSLAPPDKQPPALPLPDVPARKVGWAI